MLKENRVLFEVIPRTSKRSPNLFETDDGKEFLNIFFSDFSRKKNKTKVYSRYTSRGIVFAGIFIKTIKDLF